MIIILLLNALRETFIIFQEFMKRIFAHKKESVKVSTATPLTKPVPAFESPLKDSYASSSFLAKDNPR